MTIVNGVPFALQSFLRKIWTGVYGLPHDVSQLPDNGDAEFLGNRRELLRDSDDSGVEGLLFPPGYLNYQNNNFSNETFLQNAPFPVAGPNFIYTSNASGVVNSRIGGIEIDPLIHSTVEVHNVQSSLGTGGSGFGSTFHVAAVPTVGSSGSAGVRLEAPAAAPLTSIQSLESEAHTSDRHSYDIPTSVFDSEQMYGHPGQEPGYPDFPNFSTSGREWRDYVGGKIFSAISPRQPDQATTPSKPQFSLNEGEADSQSPAQKSSESTPEKSSAEDIFYTSDATLPVEWNVKVTPPEGSQIQTSQSSNLIRLDEVRSDARFSGIDGSNFSVVVIDTGADLDHSAFGPDNDFDGVADRIVYQYDFSGSNDADASDTNGHGTHVAGTVASQNSSYLGMAPDADLIILKVFPDFSNSANSNDIKEAAQWVVNNAANYNIAAVNFSLGSGNYNSEQITYLHNEFQSFINLGIAPVVATGNSFFSYNSAPGVAQPAADSLAWGVGAVYDANIGRVDFGSGATDFTTAPDRITSFTQRTTSPGLLDVFAPGGAITNAWLDGTSKTIFGTSMAAPHIAGIVALAQEYAVQLSGSRLPVDTLLGLIQSSGVAIVDGDDENDNVANTGGSFKRVDTFALMESILNLLGNNAKPDLIASNVSVSDATLNPGQTISVNYDISNIGTGSAIDTTAGIYISTNNIISTGDTLLATQLSTTSNNPGSVDSETQSVVIPNGLASGTYWIGVIADYNNQETNEVDESNNDSPSPVQVTVAAGGPDDYGETPGMAGSVSVGGSSTGNIETAGDEDWFAVTLQGGSIYQIDLEGSPTGGGTLSDTFLRGVYDSGSTLISDTADDDGGEGLNSLLTFAPGSSGTYYISAGAFGSNTGTYTLSVTDTIALDDYGETPGTAGSVSVGGSSSGNIETAGDEDWFAVTFQAGLTYQIDLEGSPTGGGTLSDTFLRGVYDPGSNLIGGTSDDDGGTGLNSQLTFSPTASGTHYISAGAFGSNTGTYTLSVEVEDDFGETAGTAGSVSVGGSATGNIETASDEDWFAVTLQAGSTYQIDLEGSPTGGGTLPDTFLRGIYDPSSNLIAGTTDDDSGAGLNSQLTFTATTTGAHYISAGAYATNTGTYTLSVASQLVRPVELRNGNGAVVSTYDTIQQAENAATDGYTIHVNAANYLANPEAVSTDLNGLTFDLPVGVTPTITMLEAANTLITLTGAGNGSVIGNTLSNTIFGNAGNNVLSDGGLGGNDILRGFDGNDTYIVNNAGAAIIEVAGQGTNDRVAASTDYALANGLDIELFTTTSVGATYAVNLTGNSLAQTIIGNAGDNVLSDGGLGGNDLLRGLAGNDTYIVNNAGATILEIAGQGTNDRVAASTNYSLAAGLDIELFTTTSTGATYTVSLTGNEKSQTIIGNAGVNALRSGTGAPDVLRGLGGNDIYWIYNTGDQIIESSGQGFDRVVTYVNYALGAGDSIERMQTNSTASTSNISLTGNEFAQTIIGNAGVNALRSGTGAPDVLRGLGGNDTYWIFNSGDSIVETAGQGSFDRVVSYVDYNLAAGVDVERMQTNATSGSANIALIGNELDQTIIGNAGQNYVRGQKGSDVLYGLDGNDRFAYFASDFANGAADVIKDFHEAPGDTDVLRLQGNAGNYVFTDVGSDLRVTHIASGSGTITIENFSVARLDAAQVSYFS